MSLLRLGKVSSESSTVDRDFYVAVQLDSGSGPGVPKLLSKPEDLNSYQTCYQTKLCELLLEQNIGVLALPISSSWSEINYSTLQLNEGTSFYCHPHLSTPEENLTKILPRTSESPDEFYVRRKSFGFLVKGLPSSLGESEYLIVPSLVTNGGKLIEQRVLISHASEVPYIPKEYYQRNIITSGNLLKDLESVEGLRIVDLRSLIKETCLKVLEGFLELPSYEPEMEGQLSEFSTIPELRRDLSAQLSAYILELSNIDIPCDEWRVALRSLEDELYIKPVTVSDDHLELIGSQTPFNLGGVTYIPDESGAIRGVNQPSSFNITLEQLITSLIDKSCPKGLLLIYKGSIDGTFSNLVKDCEVSKLDRLTETVLKLSNLGSRTILFKSLNKGPKGSEIKLKISRFEYSVDNCYQIEIFTADKQELYFVCTDYNTPLESLQEDFIRLRDINSKSTLVSVEVYDYRLNNERVDSLTVGDNYDSSLEVNPLRLIPQELDSYEFSLSGALEDTPSLQARLRGLELYQEYPYYPDFFVEDSLLRDFALEYLKNYKVSDEIIGTPSLDHFGAAGLLLSLLLTTTSQKRSQSLLGFNRELKKIPRFWESLTQRLSDSSTDMRMATFFGELEFQGIPTTSSYPFIYNLVNEEYLEKISERLIARITNLRDEYFSHYQYIEDIKSTLKKSRVNFIDYDNIDYFYTNIRQCNPMPNFILRFALGKLSRLVSENQLVLISKTESMLPQGIEWLISKYKSLITLASKITPSYTVKNHLLELTFEVEFPELSNQIYSLNFKLIN